MLSTVQTLPSCSAEASAGETSSIKAVEEIIYNLWGAVLLFFRCL